MSRPEQDTTKKERMDKNVTKLEFDAGNSKVYKVEAIRESAVYAKELKGHLLSCYYLVAWKGYPQKENT